MYKLIALDMDGTTFNENHEISDEVKDSLFYAMSKGVKIAFISGREEFTVKETAQYFGCCPKTIRNRRKKVLEKLKEQLENT